MLRYVSAQRTAHILEELTVDVPVPESYELITSGGLSLRNKCVNGEGPGESSRQSESDKDPPLHETINESCFRRLRTQMGVFTSQTFQVGGCLDSQATNTEVPWAWPWQSTCWVPSSALGSDKQILGRSPSVQLGPNLSGHIQVSSMPLPRASAGFLARR